MTQRLYIAGPMTGVKKCNFPAFLDAEKELSGFGYDVVNPARISMELWIKMGFVPDMKSAEKSDPAQYETRISKYEYIRNDLQALSTCNAIAFLPGWEKSEGANIELTAARGIGLSMYDYIPGSGLQVFSEKGKKFDSHKRRYDLMVWQFIESVCDVLTFGSVKYGPDNWKDVADADNRYFAALTRHVLAYRSGELADPETGISHLAHAGCNLMFLFYLTYNQRIKK